MATRKVGRRAAARKPSKKATPRRAPKKVARKTKVRPDVLQMQTASPSFTVGDLDKSIAWYTGILGFTVTERWERDGVLAGVEMRAGTVLFMLVQDDWQKGRDRVKGEGFRLYCTTRQKVDRIAERIKAAGGTLQQEPRDEPWGGRDFAVVDPDGFKITIATD